MFRLTPVKAIGFFLVSPFFLAAMPSVCAAGTASYYDATLTPLNDSGVHATAEVVLSGDELTVSIQATGLEPGKFHPQHIHGFLNPHLMPSVLPTLANADVNQNGTIDDLEGDAKMGNKILYLTNNPDISTQNTFSDFPVASSKGTENFKNTYDVTEILPFLTPLNIRGIELHGMTDKGVYTPDEPVAGGLFHQVSAPTGSGSSSGSSSVRPPAATPSRSPRASAPAWACWGCWEVMPPSAAAPHEPRRARRPVPRSVRFPPPSRPGRARRRRGFLSR